MNEGKINIPKSKPEKEPMTWEEKDERMGDLIRELFQKMREIHPEGKSVEVSDFIDKLAKDLERETGKDKNTLRLLGAFHKLIGSTVKKEDCFDYDMPGDVIYKKVKEAVEKIGK